MPGFRVLRAFRERGVLLRGRAVRAAPPVRTSIGWPVPRQAFLAPFRGDGDENESSTTRRTFWGEAKMAKNAPEEQDRPRVGTGAVCPREDGEPALQIRKALATSTALRGKRALPVQRGRCRERPREVHSRSGAPRAFFRARGGEGALSRPGRGEGGPRLPRTYVGAAQR